jgi:hypothetical protein
VKSEVSWGRTRPRRCSICGFYPASINRGQHILHLGGMYDSHLLTPLIP